jgi:hypothetical protein
MTNARASAALFRIKRYSVCVDQHPNLLRPTAQAIAFTDHRVRLEAPVIRLRNKPAK